MPAEAVVLGLGGFPNTGLLQGQLDLSERGEILVDGQAPAYRVRTQMNNNEY